MKRIIYISGAIVHHDLKPMLEEDDVHNEKHKCCICGKKFTGWGNNPRPVKNEGRCCSDCNIDVVLKERLKRMRETL